MSERVGQGTQYKGFGVSRAIGLLHVRIEIGNRTGYGNFSSVKVLKRVIDEITTTELHPAKLDELRKRYMAEVNTLREIRNVNEDAYEALWTKCAIGFKPAADTHLAKALDVLETEAARIEYDLREMKRAALLVSSIERALLEKDIPF